MEPAQQERALLERVRALGAATRTLAAASDQESLFGALVTQAKRLAGAEGAYLFELEDQSLRLVLAQDDRVDPARLVSAGQRTFSLQGTLLGRAALGEVVTLSEAPEPTPGGEGAFDHPLDAALGTVSRALLAVPLQGRSAEAPRGALLLAHSRPRGLTIASEGLIDVLAVQAAAVLDHQRARAALEAERRELVFTFAAAAELPDPEAALHVRRVTGYVRVLAEAVGLPPARAEEVALAAALHDIGKVGIPPEILYKPGKLSEAEFERTKEHCARGAELLASAQAPLLQTAAVIARAHHERWDGGGYPDGVADEAIPLPARITAVADVFDALTTVRSYRPGVGVEQALRIVAQEGGRHFDPALVHALQGSFAEILAVKRQLTLSDSGHERRAAES